MTSSRCRRTQRHDDREQQRDEIEHVLSIAELHSRGICRLRGLALGGPAGYADTKGREWSRSCTITHSAASSRAVPFTLE